MKVSVQAFQWESTSKSFSLKNFLEYLASNDKYVNDNRIIFTVKDGEYYLGIVITIKDMKKFTTIMNSADNIKLDVYTLDTKKKMADFNFFIINSEKNFGLYQYYHHSCSLATFNYLMGKRYKERIQSIISSKISELEGKNKSTINKELKKYRGKLSTKIIVRKGTLIDRVKEMRDIRNTTLEFNTLSTSGNMFQPLTSTLKAVKYNLFFTGGNGLKKVTDLAQFLSGQSLKKVRVEGIDASGCDVVYKLFNDFDAFDTFEYDDIVESLTIDLKNICKSVSDNKIVVRLKTIMKKMESIF